MKRSGPAVLVFLAALAAIAPYLTAARPSAHVELARRYAQNFSPLGWQTEWSGGSPVWMAGPAGLPTLTALAAGAGLSFERAQVWVTGLLYAWGSVGVFCLARSWKLPAGWTALGFSLAPYRWSDLVREGNAPHAAGVALLPFVLLLFSRMRRAAAAAGLAMLGIFWLPAPASGNLLPELELAMALAAGWLAARTGRRVPIILCVAVFAAGLSWTVLFERPQSRPPVSRATIEWLERHAPGEAVLGVPAPQPALNPIRRQAEDLVLGPGNPPYSLLWLEAIGVAHLVTRDRAKFDPLLDAEHEDENGYRVYQTPLRRSAPAVIVSRRQWQSLPRLASLYDRTALVAYVSWANRPQPTGFRWKTDREAEIRADLGPEEMILVRQNSGPGWKATLDGRPLECRSDPIGFLLLDPGRAGPATIVLSAPILGRGGARRLATHAVPVIDAGGIVDGVRHTPPPFAPGAVITIYGSDLGSTGATQVLVGGRPAEVLYAGERQVNARLPADLPPGPSEIVVEFGGGRSNPVGVEISAR